MLATTVLVASIVSTCSWDNPGANPYRGSVPEAVQHYTQIPKATRDKLQARMERRKYDEIATIHGDRISGKHEYEDLRSMHFGQNKICTTVSRTKWKSDAIERGLVYCEDGHCLIVPTVCNNVSIVTRKTPAVPPTESGSPGGPGFGGSVLPLVPIEPIAPISFVDFPPPVFPPPVPPQHIHPFPLFWVPPFYPPFLPTPQAPPIPEPPIWILMGLGILAIVSRKFWDRKERNQLN